MKMMKNENLDILVIGDAMLDKYTKGQVSRISPEAPIPVLLEKTIEYRLGGAANVANNVASLNHSVCLATIIGNDEYGRMIESMLCDRSKTKNDLIIKSDKYATISKERIVASGQQIVRIDHNDDKRPHTYDIDELINVCTKNITKYSVIIISDYGKGVCTENLCKRIISSANENGIPVIVDPKGVSWSKYAGAAIITPNVKEIEEYLNIKTNNRDAEIEEALESLSKKGIADNVLVTRSEKGMSLISQEGRFYNLNSEAKEVYDVSGAGDTVVAALAYGLSKGFNLFDSVKIANIAAGVVVGKAGTSVVTYKELSSLMEEESPREKAYFIDDYDSFVALVKTWKSNNETIITTNGCFDIIHAGHIKLLSEAKKMGTKLIVCVNSDDSIRRLKGNNRPINKLEDRIAVLEALACVDAIVVFDEHISTSNAASEAPLYLLRLISPDVHVKGGDYTIDSVPEAKFAKSFKTVPYLQDHSTTNVIKKRGN